MSELRLSILIPTRNREKTLRAVVSGLLESKRQDFEVVVSDNSDFAIEFEPQEGSDKRLRYVYIKDPVSMRDNCTAAINCAVGRFVVMIGDDDFVKVDECLSVAERMDEMDLDYAVSPANTYYWPFLKRRLFGSRPYGFEHQNQKLKDRLTLYPLEDLEKVLDRGGCTIGDLPRVYQGLVRRTCLQKIADQTGGYFNGPMPDMSSSAGLALVCRSGFKPRHSFVINGVSSNSGGGKGAAGKHSGAISDAYGLTQKDKDNWPCEVRSIWSGGTVWAASLVLTLRAFDREDLIRRLDLASIDGYLLSFHPLLSVKFFGVELFSVGSLRVAMRSASARLSSFVRNVRLYSRLPGVGSYNSIVDYYRDKG